MPRWVRKAVAPRWREGATMRLVRLGDGEGARGQTGEEDGLEGEGEGIEGAAPGQADVERGEEDDGGIEVEDGGDEGAEDPGVAGKVSFGAGLGGGCFEEAETVEECGQRDGDQ